LIYGDDFRGIGVGHEEAAALLGRGSGRRRRNGQVNRKGEWGGSANDSCGGGSWQVESGRHDINVAEKIGVAQRAVTNRARGGHRD
jgi:hypothetical protein